MYSYSCVCGWSADLRGTWDVKSVPCGNCDRDVRRQQVYSFNVAGFTPVPLDQRSYVQEFKDYQEATQEIEYVHGRAEEALGKSLPTPPLARTAIKRARTLKALGVKDSHDLKEREKH